MQCQNRDKYRFKFTFRKTRTVNRANKLIQYENPEGLKARLIKLTWRFVEEKFSSFHQIIAHCKYTVISMTTKTRGNRFKRRVGSNSSGPAELFHNNKNNNMHGPRIVDAVPYMGKLRIEMPRMVSHGTSGWDW